MVALLAAAMLVFVVICSGVGLRLLWLAKHGAGRPAWLCGGGFACIGLIGFPLGVASGQGSAAAGEVRLALSVLALVGSTAGIGCFFLFVVSVFRPGVGWARGIAAAGIAGLIATSIGIVGATAAAPPDLPSAQASFAWAISYQLLGVGCFAWMAAEGMREWARSKKRLALGLADEVSTHRLLLWGLFGIGTTLNNLVVAAVMLAGLSWSESLVAQLSQSACGLAASAFVLLAFSPTRSLRGLLLRSDR